MKLDISRLKSGTLQVERAYDPQAFDLTGEEFRLVGPVTLAAEVRRDDQKVRLVGRMGATLECDCGRCLDPIAVPVAAALDLLYLPETAASAAASGEAERETAEDDFGVAYFKDEEIDLGALLREQFYLALPMKPLCSERCKGLCPVCGINRNRETCACQVEWVDPRLEPLKHLGKAR